MLDHTKILHNYHLDFLKKLEKNKEGERGLLSM
jgi:hypothetical protein